MAMLHLLGLDVEAHEVYFGANSSSIFQTIASNVIPALPPNSEVVVSSCNHTSNYNPWLSLCKSSSSSCRFVEWNAFEGSPVMQTGYAYHPDLKSTLSLLPPITPETGALVIPHASNVLGVVYDLQKICKHAREISPSIVIVVDGVAAVPHRYAAQDAANVDFYVVSCHKFFVSISSPLYLPFAAMRGSACWLISAAAYPLSLSRAVRNSGTSHGRRCRKENRD